jgi:hypothetical protein
MKLSQPDRWQARRHVLHLCHSNARQCTTTRAAIICDRGQGSQLYFIRWKCAVHQTLYRYAFSLPLDSLITYRTHPQSLLRLARTVLHRVQLSIGHKLDFKKKKKHCTTTLFDELRRPRGQARSQLLLSLCLRHGHYPAPSGAPDLSSSQR